MYVSFIGLRLTKTLEETFCVLPIRISKISRQMLLAEISWQQWKNWQQ